MPVFKITAPDGTVYKVTGPDGSTEAQALEQVKAQHSTAAPAPVAPAPGYKVGVGEQVDRLKSVGVGTARGVKDLIDTGAQWLSNLGGSGEAARVKSMNDAGKGQFKADYAGDPYAQGGRVFGQVVGTLPVGPVLGSVARAAGAGAPVVNALASGGMTTGAAAAPGMVNALMNVGGRAVAGGVVGGLSAGLVDPESAKTGAIIGALTPPVLKVLGTVGGAIGQMFKSGAIRSGEDLAKALDLVSPAERAAAIAKLRATSEMVPGSAPTVAQALRTPQASTLESIVSDSPGGMALKERYLAQNAARKGALEGVAPTNPLGLASAKADTGEAIGRLAKPARAAARAETSALYNSVPQDEAMLYLPELAPVRDKLYGPASFTDRAAVDKAVDTARRVGTVQVGGVVPAKGAETSLLQFVKSNGGINRSAESSREFAGEVGDLMQQGIGRVAFKDRGQSIERMAERAWEAGYIPDDDPVTLISALRSNPRATASGGGLNVQRAAEAAMGDAPMAERVPVKVSLKDFEDLRASIGQEQRAAGMAGNSKAAKALGDMKAALDDRINQVVAGDGAADEVLPLDWADKLSQARASKVAEVQRFGTGPQAGIFKQGADGQPVKQGAEIASAFWGARPGLKEDVQSFRRLIADNPDLLGRFRGMVTTEGASTATNAGNLTGSYARWFKSHLPGIKEAFEPEQVLMMGRIAADIQRAEQAAAAGASRGSPTFRNAANALDVGLIGSPAVKAAAGRIPFVGRVAGAGVDWAAGSLAKGKANRLAELMADVDASANALSSVGTGPQHNALQRLLAANPEALNLLYRAMPVGLGANR
jgi:hypothetical protein